MEVSAEVTFVETFMEVSVEITFVKAFMEVSVEVSSMESSVEASMEASVEVNFLEASTKNFRGSYFHGSFHGSFYGSFHGIEVWKLPSLPWKLSRASTENGDSAGGPSNPRANASRDNSTPLTRSKAGCVFFFNYYVYFPAQLVGGFTLSDLLNKPQGNGHRYPLVMPLMITEQNYQ